MYLNTCVYVCLRSAAADRAVGALLTDSGHIYAHHGLDPIVPLMGLNSVLLARAQKGAKARCRGVAANAQRLRVDRALSSLGYCTRSECPKFLKSHMVSVEGMVISKPSMKVCLTHNIVRRSIPGSMYRRGRDCSVC
eukprot:jgi/Ulvmu1/6183/UM028_0039.1